MKSKTERHEHQWAVRVPTGDVYYDFELGCQSCPHSISPASLEAENRQLREQLARRGLFHDCDCTEETGHDEYCCATLFDKLEAAEQERDAAVGKAALFDALLYLRPDGWWLKEGVYGDSKRINRRISRMIEARLDALTLAQQVEQEAGD